LSIVSQSSTSSFALAVSQFFSALIPMLIQRIAPSEAKIERYKSISSPRKVASETDIGAAPDGNEDDVLV
jgi:hypothetical protein